MNFPVDDRVVQGIFGSEIWPDLIENKPQPQLSPSLYVLGGQPGAGKSQLEKWVFHNHGNNFVSINGDEFRKFHPNFNEIEKQYGTEAANHTAAFSGMITGMALNRAATEKLNVLVEGTFRTVETPINTLGVFKKLGYETTVMIATCPKEVSWSSTLERYRNMEQANIPARYTPKPAHDIVIENLAVNAQKVLDSGLVDRMQIFSRKGQLLDTKDGGGDVITPIENELHRDLTSIEQQIVKGT